MRGVAPKRLSEGRRDVRQDPALGMVGAFRPLLRGVRGKLNETMQWGEATINWKGSDQLGIGDQSVLLAVQEVAMEQLSGDDRCILVGPGDALWTDAMHHQQHVFVPELVRVVTSYRRLSLLCGGSDSGAELEQVRASLKRLAEVTVWVTRGKLVGGSRLLGWQVGDDQRVVLVLNWRLTQALQGIQYSRISMAERASLPSEAAKALHAVLSCKVSMAKAWDCCLDDLQRYIWGDTLHCGAGRRKRHAKLRTAITAIGKLRGWTAKAESDGTVHIARGSATWTAVREQSGKRPPVVTGTPRINGHEAPEERARPTSKKPSIHAGFQVVDASVLIT